MEVCLFFMDIETHFTYLRDICQGENLMLELHCLSKGILSQRRIGH